MGRSLTLSLYLAAARRGDAIVRRRLLRRDGTPAHARQRMGQSPGPRPEGPVVWLHLARPEFFSHVRDLLHRMADQRPELCFVLTVPQHNAQTLDPADLPNGSKMILAPSDTGRSVRNFLDHWRPELCIWVGLDLRPLLCVETERRDIAMLAIDGPQVQVLQRNWRWFPGLTGAIMSRFSRTLVKDASAAIRRRKLGVPPRSIEELGQLEETTPALPCNEAERDALASDIAARPVWLAAQICGEEDEIIMQAHCAALKRAHRLLLILVPDDPARASEIAGRYALEGLSVAIRSEGQDPGPEIQVYIADYEDEMGLWYRLAPLSFMGRSIGAGGGITPNDPAALGSAILHGPNVHNFRDAYARLAAAGATILVRDAEQLSAAIELLQAPDKPAVMAHAAWDISSSAAEVTDRLIQLGFEAIDLREERGVL
ncbi:3-deoxy-D-manno-octulosonic acid transferase [Candidatus Halocynthiibacter alkanivorans]|jgi:3-deoxy-D-manno-octulosonic-acid transferase|uniref:3-deoxy-D-manno-octulosonic acid transferase n=1 Tax=Candidatus Halocynthiibacter alkanivorans TaxID=2267619 RepID=UPI000DF1D53B|nr:glycosyltransferase N-terminal domain-containing protein [Candidatus Halocynthiibacter alkanivorans]